MGSIEIAAQEPFRVYLRDLRANLAAGNATEHTHRPALKALLEGAVAGVTATNEPRRIECGAPDFVISRRARESAGSPQPVGYVEAKDSDVDLDAVERDSKRSNPRTANGKQLKRYRAALSNLLLTNYLEFRWYVDGEPTPRSSRWRSWTTVVAWQWTEAGSSPCVDCFNTSLSRARQSFPVPKI